MVQRRLPSSREHMSFIIFLTRQPQLCSWLLLLDTSSSKLNRCRRDLVHRLPSGLNSAQNCLVKTRFITLHLIVRSKRRKKRKTLFRGDALTGRTAMRHRAAAAKNQRDLQFYAEELHERLKATLDHGKYSMESSYNRMCFATICLNMLSINSSSGSTISLSISLMK